MYEELSTIQLSESTLAKDVYRVSANTFTTLVTLDIGITHQRTLSPADLKRIVNHYDFALKGIEIE